MPKKTPSPKAGGSVRRSPQLFYALPVLFVLGLFGFMAFNKYTHRGPPVRQMSSKPFTSIKIDGLDAQFFAQTDAVRAAGSDLFIEFRNSQGTLADVGTVDFEMVLDVTNAVTHAIDAVLHSNGKVMRTATPGQYRTTVEPGLAGEWTATLRFSGAQGTAKTNFLVKVM
jgi:hypothetical protein